MKKITFSLICLFLSSLIFAQNSTLLDYKEPQFSTDLNKLCNKKTADFGDLNGLIKYFHKSFSTDHLYYNQIQVVMPIYDGLIDWSYVKKIRTTFFKDAKQVKAVYKAALPVFQAQFEKMTNAERNAYLLFLQNGIDYALNFDLSKEQADLKADEYGFRENKGELQAFIYRRIANDEISKADCIKWLKQLKKDLEAVKTPKNQGKEADYYLSEQPDLIGFVSGRKFGEPEADFVFFEKKQNAYVLLDFGNIINYTNVDKNVYMCVASKNDSANVYRVVSGEKPLLLGSELATDAIALLPLTKNALQVGTQVVYAVNENGQAEKNLFPEGSFIFLFKFKSGKKQLLHYNYNEEESSLVSKLFESFEYQTKELYYNYTGKGLWLLSNSNALFCFMLGPGFSGPYAQIQLQETFQSFKTLTNRTALVYYQSGKIEYIYYDDNQLKIIVLPSAYTCKNLVEAKIGLHSFYLLYTEDDLCGVLDENGKLIIAPGYDNIYNLGSDDLPLKYFLVFKNGKQGILNTHNQVILPANYTYVSVLPDYQTEDKAYFLFSNDIEQSFGLVDEKGKEIIAQKYASIQIVENASKELLYFKVADSEGKKGLIDLSGKVLMAPKYNYLEPINNATHFICSQSKADELPKMGIVNATDKQLYPNVLLDIAILPMNSKGEILTECFFAAKEQPNKERKYAIFSSKTMQPISDFIFSAVEERDSIMTFDPDNFEEILQIVDFKYICLDFSNENRQMLLTKNGKKVLYDYDAQELVGPIWDDFIFSARKDYFIAKKAGKTGLVKANGKLLIPVDFDEIWVDEIAPLTFVRKMMPDSTRRYALYSLEGKALTAFDFSDETRSELLYTEEGYEHIEQFVMPGTNKDTVGRCFIMQQGNKKVLYSFDAKPIIPAQYPVIEFLCNDGKRAYYKVGDTDEFALFDHSGKALSGFFYKNISLFEDGLFEAIDENDNAIRLDRNGKQH